MGEHLDLQFNNRFVFFLINDDDRDFNQELVFLVFFCITKIISIYNLNGVLISKSIATDCRRDCC